MADAFDFVIEKGERGFDRTIKSEGKDSKKLKKEGTRKKPFNPGVFQEVKNIDWGAGQFTYVGQSIDQAGDFCQAGWAEDGQNWFANTSFTIGGDSRLNVSIRGEDNDSMVILAGGSHFVPIGVFQQQVIGFNDPILCMSFDDGKGWERVNCPTEGEEFKNGEIEAVGYDPKEKQFYARARYTQPGNLPDINVTLTGIPTAGFGEFFRGDGFPPFPQKMKLCDIGSETRSDIKYVSSNSGKQIIKTSDGDGNKLELSINTISAPRANPVSLAARAGIMVVVCNPSGSSGGDRFIFVSEDGGAGWDPVLPELATTFSGSIFAGTVSCS